MTVAVEFQDERLDLEIPESRLVTAWHGPAGVPDEKLSQLVDSALETPLDFPPLRQAVVPGDRVVVALGDRLPSAPVILSSAWRILKAAGVEPTGVTLLTSTPAGPGLVASLPAGATFRTHDPATRAEIAYLATTTSGSRVYLDRELADADFVLPIGRLGFDPFLGYDGPWGTIFPTFADAASIQAMRSRASDQPPDRGRPNAQLSESTEVTWLLGSQFQVGVLPGSRGVSRIVAGLAASVLAEGTRAVDDTWTCRPETRAELVICGVGSFGALATIEDLAQALANASRLVQRGGKIAVLSRAEGSPGLALRRLIETGESRGATSALRGLESEPDYSAALTVARVLDWADIYLLSQLDADDVEGLSMVPLDRPEEVRRLAAVSVSCTVLSHAERTQGRVLDESE